MHILVTSQAQLQAELQVIGSLTVGSFRKWELVTLEPEDFSQIALRRIWAAARSLCQKGLLPDPSMVLAEAKFSDQEHKELLPSSTLTNAMLSHPTDANVEYWVENLKSVLVDARMAEISSLSQDRMAAGDDTVAVCEWAGEEERKVKAKFQPSNEHVAISEDCYQVLATAIEGKRPEGLLYTGVGPLDYLCGGLIPGEYVVLAARPSCGKTSMILNILVSLARRGIQSTFFSLEMSRQMVASSIAAIVTKVSGRKLLREPHKITDEERQHLMEKGNYVWQVSKNIRVFAIPGMKAAEMASIVRQDVRSGSRLIAVDHVLLTSESAENETQRIGKFSKAWNAICKENKVAGIALAQLNRDNVKETREPKPNDLKQSGSLEEDADVIWFIHPPKGIITTAREKVKLLQAKGRTCGVGFAEAMFDGPTQTFSQLEEDYYEEHE